MPKIPLYPASTTPNQDDLLILEDSVTSNTKKIKRSDLLGGNIINATNNVATDTISELTAAAGVTIDGCPIKDKLIVGGAAQGVANSSLSTTSGDLGGAWASWTPTWTSLDIAKATLNYATYSQIGKTVFFELSISLTDAAISGSVSFTLPVAVKNKYISQLSIIPGEGFLINQGVTSYYAKLRYLATNAATILVQAANGTYLNYAALSATVPHTWKNTDRIIASGYYEAA